MISKYRKEKHFLIEIDVWYLRKSLSKIYLYHVKNKEYEV